MKKVFVLAILFLSANYCSAQASDSTKTPNSINSDDDNIVFTLTEVYSKFPGGDSAWIGYLQRNLSGFNPATYGAPNGMYRVIVKFIVMRDGSIRDVVAETNNGYRTEEEAIRIIKQGPKWIPAMQNGFKVNSYRRQPFTFVVQQ